MSHPAYRTQRDREFETNDYSFAALQQSMTHSNLTIESHESGYDDDISRLDPAGVIPKPSYLFDVGTTLQYLIGDVLTEERASPQSFLNVINQSSLQDEDFAVSLSYMTNIENVLRRVVGQVPDPNVLTNTGKYPLLIWAVVMNLSQSVKKAPVPTLITAEELGLGVPSVI
jgi:hypothetical protein